VNPIEAGLTFGVRLKKTDYTGIDALKRIKADGPTRTLVGLTVEGRRIPRDGYPVCIDGEPVGSVASGTFSPTFEVPIATALVTLSAIHDDCVFSIDIRGKMVSATRVELPFYRRDGTGSLHKDNNN
jgi:aminomethyltransferase